MVNVTLTESGIPVTDLTGMAVYASDGEQFAYVRAVSGGYIELDVPWASDYWLSDSYVERVDSTGLYLSLTREQTKEHRLRAPGIEAKSAPDRAATEDHVLSDAQALRQREMMERQMFGEK